MTHYVHTYQLVGNPYKNGKLSTQSFVGVEWRTEKMCACGATLPYQRVL